LRFLQEELSLYAGNPDACLASGATRDGEEQIVTGREPVGRLQVEAVDAGNGRWSGGVLVLPGTQDRADYEGFIEDRTRDLIAETQIGGDCLPCEDAVFFLYRVSAFVDEVLSTFSGGCSCRYPVKAKL
jgi:hypothetical protein